MATDQGVGGVIGGAMAMKAFQSEMTTESLQQTEVRQKIKLAQEAMDFQAKRAQMAMRKVAEHEDATGKPSTDVERLMAYATASTELGYPEKGLEIVKEVAHSELEMANAREKVLKSTIEMRTEMANEMDPEVIKTVKDWRVFLGSWAMRHPEFSQNPQTSQILQGMLNSVTSDEMVPYVVGETRKGMLSQVEQEQIKLHEAQAKAAEARARKDNYEVDVYLPKQTEIARTRAEHLAKAGAGKGATGPLKPEEIRSATDLIMSEYRVMPEKARTLAREVAERSRELVDGGMTITQANKAALSEMRKKGELAGLKPKRSGPGSAEAPLPAPPDASKMVVNNWYTPPPGSKMARDGVKKFLYLSPTELIPEGEE
jgi:hypothetical protein